MAEITIETLIQAVTATQIYARLVTIASALGLETESWRKGDPTRTTFDAVSRTEETRDADIVLAIKGGFLDLASGSWLTLLARHGFNVERVGATYASATVRYTNGAAAQVEIENVDDVTARNSASKATYRNTEIGTLLGGIGETLDIIFEAEVAGSGGTSGVGEIDELVDAIPNVSIASITSAVGVDAESDADLRARCRAKMQSISSGGPKGAYEFFATTPEYNGGANVTRVRVFPQSTTGHVTVIVAGPSGAVDPGDVTLVEDAIAVYATPLCITADVASASNLSLPITYGLAVYDTINKTSDEIKAIVSDALTAAFLVKKPGFDITPDTYPEGTVYKAYIEAVILNAVAPHGFSCVLTLPAADTNVVGNEVVIVGTITATVTVVAT